jgi:hypothetical protein
MLIEALIAMLLLGLVGVAPAYVAARMAVSHKQMNVGSNAVAQLRALLMAQGNALCGTAPEIRIGGTALTVDVSCTDRGAVQVGGVTLAASDVPPSIVLSVESQPLFGGGGVIVVGE